MILEICTFSISDVEQALAAGADRIELCASYVEGGITPSEGNIRAAFELVDPQHVVIMIRPRGGNFIYNDAEFEVMRRDIDSAKQLGAQQVIFGILGNDGRLDKARNSALVEQAHPMQCVLQRAFDLARDPFEALEDAIACGFTRILTSGQHPNAWDGREIIKQLIERSAGRIQILPGAGVNSRNADALIRYTGCDQIHTSAKRPFTEPATVVSFRTGIYDNSHMTEVHPGEVSALKKITLEHSK